MLKRLIHPAAAFFLLTVLVALLSWVGSVYGWHGVNNMLSGEGVRWRFHTLVADYFNAPFLDAVLLMSFGVGLLLHSRLWKLCADAVTKVRKPSRKERRGLIIAACFAILYTFFILLLAYGPFLVVRNIAGTLQGSALADGAWFLVSFGLGSTAVIYAYSVDFYNSHWDILRGMSHGVTIIAPYLVTLFFVVQFFTALFYTGLAVSVGISDAWLNHVYSLFCIILVLLPLR